MPLWLRLGVILLLLLAQLSGALMLNKDRGKNTLPFWCADLLLIALIIWGMLS